MKLTVEHKKGLTILRLQEKRLDAAIAPHLKSKLALLIEAEGEKYLVIDLGQVQGIDSSGIGALLLAHRTTLAHDGFAAFIGVREPVRDLLKMTHLDKQLYIFNSVQDVLNNLETVETDDEPTDDELDELLESPKSGSSKSDLDVDTDADDSEDFLDDLPEIDDENLPELDLSMDEVDEIEFSEEEEPKQKKKSSKRTPAKRSSTKAKATTKSKKTASSKTKKSTASKTAASKAKSKKKSKA
ncbi:MAG: STAS domain-containing protein [Candidatus Thermochlorobacter sp.]